MACKVTSRLDDIKASYTEDKCYIAGICVLNENWLVVTDSSNCSVKLISIEDKRDPIKGYVKLSKSPRGITVISIYKVAVVIPDERWLTFIDIEDTVLKVSNRVDAKGQCNGVDYDKELDLLAVCCSDKPPRVILLKGNGDVVCTIQSSSDWNYDFNKPFYVRFYTSATEKCLYVSDQRQITCVSVNNSEWKFKFSKKIKYIDIPRDLCVLSETCLLVCCKKTYAVCAVSETCDYQKTLITEDDGLDNPCAMAFSNGKLYVSCNFIEADRPLSDWIKVYKLPLPVRPQ